MCKHELATLPVNLNCVSKDQHILEVKRLIHTTKERCRCSFHNAPFKKLHRGPAIGLPRSMMFYLNAFPHIDGVSRELSLYTIVQEKLWIITYIVKWLLESIHKQGT